MKKVKNISYKHLSPVDESKNTEKVVKYEVNGETFEVLIKWNTSILEKTGMIKDILDTLFITNPDGDIEYHPELKDFAIRYTIIDTLTNITLPKNVEEAYKVLMDEALIAYVEKQFDIYAPNFFEGFISEVMEAINFKKAKVIQASKSDVLYKEIGSFMSAVNEKFGSMEPFEIIDYIKKNDPEFGNNIKDLVKEESMKEENPTPSVE